MGCTEIASYKLHHQTGRTIMAAYVPPAQGIKPLIVHPNELHRAQPTFFFAATNLID